MHAQAKLVGLMFVGACFGYCFGYCFSVQDANAQRIWSPSNQPAINTYPGATGATHGGAWPAVSQPQTFVPAAPGWDPYTCQPNACAPVPILPSVPIEPHRNWHLFGEFLFLRPNDAAMVSYALPINGPIVPPPTPPVPGGPVAFIDPGYEPGYRIGGGFSWSDTSEISAAYTWYESDASSAVTLVVPGPPDSLQSLVMHPSTLAAGTTFTMASASGSVDFQIIDIDYQQKLVNSWFRTSYVLGGRYVNLDQAFTALFTGGVAPGPAMQDVTTQIDFDGGGIRVGIKGDATSQRTGLFGYANGFASFLAGDFTSTFRQTDATAMPIVVATTSRTDDRVVPILDLELGVGWQSAGGSWRFSAGYLFSAWFNVVSTDDFIRAVHTSQFGGLSDTLTFDGLTAQVDWRF